MIKPPKNPIFQGIMLEIFGLALLVLIIAKIIILGPKINPKTSEDALMIVISIIMLIIVEILIHWISKESLSFALYYDEIVWGSSSQYTTLSHAQITKIIEDNDS